MSKELQGTKPEGEPKRNPIDIFRGQMEGQKKDFRGVLPSHISFEKFQRTVMTAIVTNPNLLTADRQSLLVSCVKAATDGLLPDNRDAALVIFKTKQGTNWIEKVQYMPMYSGILKKVRNSGEVSSVVTHIVYENDKFEYVLGDEERIVHEPYLGKEERGELIAAYCIAKLKDGSIVREVMTRHDIEKVRKTSKSGAMNEYDVKNSKDKDAKIGDPKGIWRDWYEEMARKTVFRRTSKWLPQNIEIYDQAFANDETMAGFDEIDASEPIATEDQTGGDEEIDGQPDLKEKIEEKKAQDSEGDKEKPAPKCENCDDKKMVEQTDPDTGENWKEPCKACAPKQPEQTKLV